MSPDIFKLEWSGDDQVRVSSSDTIRLRAFATQIRTDDRFTEVVDGGSNLTILFDPLRFTGEEVWQSIKALAGQAGFSNSQTLTEITLEVRFGGKAGPDLESSAQALNISTQELITALCSAELYVDMMGFTPGFSYIRGLPDELTVPRLTSPRKSVPSGSLGMAAGMLGTYALEGPGGWPIVGQVITPLFRKESQEPFLLMPGCGIRLISAGRNDD